MSCDDMTMRIGERLDFAVNYRRELSEFADTVATSVWAIDPSAGVTLDDDTINNAAVTLGGETIPAYMMTSTYVAGVSVGAYVLTNTATTTQGRVFVRSINIAVSA